MSQDHNPNEDVFLVLLWFQYIYRTSPEFLPPLEHLREDGELARHSLLSYYMTAQIILSHRNITDVKVYNRFNNKYVETLRSLETYFHLKRLETPYIAPLPERFRSLLENQTSENSKPTTQFAQSSTSLSTQFSRESQTVQNTSEKVSKSETSILPSKPLNPEAPAFQENLINFQPSQTAENIFFTNSFLPSFCQYPTFVPTALPPPSPPSPPSVPPPRFLAPNRQNRFWENEFVTYRQHLKPKTSKSNLLQKPKVILAQETNVKI